MPSQTQVVICGSDLLVVIQRFTKPPSSGSINLLEWLTEIRRTFSLLDYQFITKDITRNSQMERCIGQGKWERARASVPSLGAPVSQHFCMFTNLQVLLTSPIGFLWRLHYLAWLIKSLAFYDGTQSLALPPPWRFEVGNAEKFQPFNYFVSPGNQPPSFGTFQKSPH